MWDGDCGGQVEVGAGWDIDNTPKTRVLPGVSHLFLLSTTADSVNMIPNNRNVLET